MSSKDCAQTSTSQPLTASLAADQGHPAASLAGACRIGALEWVGEEVACPHGRREGPSTGQMNSLGSPSVVDGRGGAGTSRGGPGQGGHQSHRGAVGADEGPAATQSSTFQDFEAASQHGSLSAQFGCRSQRGDHRRGGRAAGCTQAPAQAGAHGGAQAGHPPRGEGGGWSCIAGRNGPPSEPQAGRPVFSRPSGRNFDHEVPTLWPESPSRHANRAQEGMPRPAYFPAQHAPWQHRPLPHPGYEDWEAPGGHPPCLPWFLDACGQHSGGPSPFTDQAEATGYSGLPYGSWRQNFDEPWRCPAGGSGGVAFGGCGYRWEGQPGAGMANYPSRREAWNQGGYTTDMGCENMFPRHFPQQGQWRPCMAGSAMPTPPPPHLQAMSGMPAHMHQALLPPPPPPPPPPPRRPSHQRSHSAFTPRRSQRSGRHGQDGRQPDSGTSEAFRHFGIPGSGYGEMAAYGFQYDLELDRRRRRPGGTNESRWHCLAMALQHAVVGPAAARPFQMVMQNFMDCGPRDGLTSDQFAHIDEITVGKQLSIEDLTSLMDTDSPQCCICIEGFKAGDRVRMLPCNHQHMFHTICIWGWVKEHHECPICRGDLKLLLGMMGADSRRHPEGPEPPHGPQDPAARRHAQDDRFPERRDGSRPPEWYLEWLYGQSSAGRGRQSAPDPPPPTGTRGRGLWSPRDGDPGRGPGDQAGPSRKEQRGAGGGRCAAHAHGRSRRSTAFRDPAPPFEGLPPQGEDGKVGGSGAHVGGHEHRPRSLRPREPNQIPQSQRPGVASAPRTPIGQGSTPPPAGGDREGDGESEDADCSSRLSVRDPVVSGPPRGSHNKAVGSPVARPGARAKVRARHRSADAGSCFTGAGEGTAPWWALMEDGPGAPDPGDREGGPKGGPGGAESEREGEEGAVGGWGGPPDREHQR